MITFLEGTLAEKSPARLIIRVGGIGYEVFIPLSSFDHLPPENQNCCILIYEYIREDQHSLFGFMSELERKTFTMLMNVNGIGPKLAMSALSGLAVSELITAIVSGDVERLTSVAGIGKKMAERMIVELRDKLAVAGMTKGAAVATGSGTQNIRVADAILALVSLGYRQAEASKMVASAVSAGDEDMSVEEIIRRALRR